MTPRSDRFTLGKRPGTHSQETPWAPGSVWTTYNTQHKHPCTRRDFLCSLFLSLYLTPTCFFVFIVLHFAFCLLLTTHNTNTHVPGRIRNRNLNKRSAAEPRLRPLDHWGSAMENVKELHMRDQRHLLCVQFALCLVADDRHKLHTKTKNSRHNVIHCNESFKLFMGFCYIV